MQDTKPPCAFPPEDANKKTATKDEKYSACAATSHATPQHSPRSYTFFAFFLPPPSGGLPEAWAPSSPSRTSQVPSTPHVSGVRSSGYSPVAFLPDYFAPPSQAGVAIPVCSLENLTMKLTPAVRRMPACDARRMTLPRYQPNFDAGIGAPDHLRRMALPINVFSSWRVPCSGAGVTIRKPSGSVASVIARAV